MVLHKLAKNFKYHYSLSLKFFICLVLAVLIPVVSISISSIYIINRFIQAAEGKHQMEQLKTVMTTVDYNFGMYMYKSNIIFSNAKLQKTLSEPPEVTYEHFEAILDINNFLDSIRYDVNYVHFNYTKLKYLYESVVIRIYAVNAGLDSSVYVHDFSAVASETWVQQALKTKGVLWHLGRNRLDQEVLYLSRRLLDFRNQQLVGVLNIEIPISIIEQTLVQRQVNDDQLYFLYNEEKQLVTSIQGQESTDLAPYETIANQYLQETAGQLSRCHLDDKKYFLTSVQSEVTGWYLVSMIPVSYMSEGSRVMTYYTIIIALVGCLIAAIIALALKNLMVGRLHLLMEKLGKMERRQYQLVKKMEGEDEIAKLDHVLHDMVTEMIQLVEKEYQMELAGQKLKLDLLQEQMNPHLLYNTLSTLSYQAKENQHTTMSTAIDHLICFYRLSLNKGQILITLGEELDLVAHYINIIKYTYHLEFDVILNIPKEFHELGTTKLILQPIVENAVLHGLRYSEKPGLLKISASRVEDFIEIIIEDNGVGMPQNIINMVLNSTYLGHHATAHFGLTNVMKRLSLTYGSSRCLHIESQLNQGTKVTLRMAHMDLPHLRTSLQQHSSLQEI